jgi:steroid 5-alpha reductase family enzyme
VVTDIVLPWLGAELASIPVEVLALFGTALLLSAIGFYRTVLFISIGYGLSIAGMAFVSLILFRHAWSWYSVIQAILLVTYGLRLALYLLRREFKPLYRNRSMADQERSPVVPVGRQVLIWLGVSILYVLMFSPAIFSLSTIPQPLSPGLSVVQVIGLMTMFGGLSIEAVADYQKSVFKAREPKRFCNTGLYRWVRCPNYLGEIMFWIGNWGLGLMFYTTELRWVMGLAGVICIVLIMLGSTKRLERAQHERYAHLSQYQAYAQTVPVLIPFVPLYTLKNIRVYLE